MQQIRESDVKAMLESMVENLPDFDREALKDFCAASSIELLSIMRA
jgi:hypothetical protein